MDILPADIDEAKSPSLTITEWVTIRIGGMGWGAGLDYPTEDREEKMKKYRARQTGQVRFHSTVPRK